jgi:hypothetical protein
MKLGDHPRRSLAAILTAVMATSVLPAGALAQGAPLDAAAADALITDIEAEVVAAEAALGELQATRLRPAAIVEQVGSDPVALRDWVAQQTRWVPYQGTLRGADGVLMDRQGNSLDRALLLAAVLEAAGHEPTLQRTLLDTETAAALLAAAMDVAPPVAPADPAPETLARRDSIGAAGARLWELLELDRRVAAADDTEALAAMADHWWVRLGDAAGAVELDPVFGDDASARPAAASTYDADDLPEELGHTVTVSVVIERLDADGLAEEVVLEQAIPLDEPVIAADLWFDYDFGQEAAPGDRATTAEVAAAPFWRPVLVLDSTRYGGDWFGPDGQLGVPNEPRTSSAFGEGASALGALGDDDADPAAESYLSGAWIEYRSEGPGRTPRVEIRELFDAIADHRGDPVDATAALASADLVDPLVRGSALLGETAMLLLGATVDDATIEAAHYRDVIDSRSGRIAATYLAAGREDDRIAPSLQTAAPLPIPLLVASRLRDWWSADPGRAFVAEPTILTSHLTVASDGTNDRADYATDVVINHIGVMGDQADAAAVRVRQGLLDTRIESELFGAEAEPNTWDRFEAAGDAAAWVAVTTTDELDALGQIPPGERARLARSLAAGNALAVAPGTSTSADTEHLDWWKVATDGTTLGMGANGWGAVILEGTGIRGGESLKAYSMRMQAIQICRRFGVAATVLNVYVIQVELHRSAGLRPPMKPRQLSCPVR